MILSEADLTTYAAAVAAVGAGQSEDVVLARLGLDAARFAALERAVEERLSLALEREDGVDPFVSLYDKIMRQAQAALVSQPTAPLERFAQALAALGAGEGDAVKALARVGLTPAELMRASREWAPKIAADPAVAARFVALRTPKKPGS